MTFKKLALLPSLAAVPTRDGLVVTKKFLSGIQSFIERWPGPIKVVFNTTDKLSNNLDNTILNPETAGFEAVGMSYDPKYRKHLLGAVGDADVVLSGPSYELHGIHSELTARYIASVAVVEYSLKTRLDIVLAEAGIALKAAKRAVWEAREEYRTRLDIAEADGVQCNGMPTFEAYSELSRHPHLYFDTRVSQSDFATEEQMHMRTLRLRNHQTLNLAFSGRLIKMKGADHLVPFARELRRLGIDFHMTICGDGSLISSIDRQLLKHKLYNHVELAGVLSFEEELLPMLKNEIDLFVLPHVQGDPSCTYVETMGCGVPIVGYANEAWAGILKREDVGWSSPIGDPKKLAKLVADIAHRRMVIDEMAHRSLRFAKDHSLEQTFDRRVEHLMAVVSQKSFK